MHIYAATVHSLYWGSAVPMAPHQSADWHAFTLDKEPLFDSLLVYNQNEDSFNHHVMLHNNSLSDDEVLNLRKNVQCYQ